MFQMKKIIVALLAILYMGSSSGIAMDIHYCMGKESGVEFYGAGNSKCSKCGMTEKKGCCHDKQQFYKLKDAHKTVSNDVDFGFSDVAILHNYAVYNWLLTGTNADKKVQNHSPPNFSTPSICIMNCIFRI